MKRAFAKSQKNTLGVLAGAPRFELGNSCAHRKWVVSWKSFLYCANYCGVTLITPTARPSA